MTMGSFFVFAASCVTFNGVNRRGSHLRKEAIDLSMQLVLTQILVILLYVAVGFMAGKTRLILPEHRKFLSGLCSNLILPFTILSASAQAVSGEKMKGLLVSLGFFFAVYACVTVLSLIATRGKTPGRRAAVTGLLTYSNCTFLGLPLCQALFGDMAVLYNVSALIAFNVLFFTVQYSLFTGGKMNLKNLLTPTTLSTAALVVMLVLKLRFPDPVQTVCVGVGSMISPLSLIIIGVMLSESAFTVVLREKQAYLLSVLRNLAIPLAGMLLLRLLPLDSSTRLCVLVYLACPCATLTSIYAIKFDMEPEFCAHTVLLSTILFAATLPMIISLGQLIL